MPGFVVRDNGIGIEPQYVERIFACSASAHSSGLSGLVLDLRLQEDRGATPRTNLFESTQGVGARSSSPFPGGENMNGRRLKSCS
jgi:light-regulated signal transduction histidine kinase (bacteriophytochrome)